MHESDWFISLQQGKQCRNLFRSDLLPRAQSTWPKKKKEEHFYRFKVDILCLKPNIINNRLFILAKTCELEVSLARSFKTDRLKGNYYKKCKVVSNRQKTR